jgi:two-component system chemotaxis response regulator CheY
LPEAVLLDWNMPIMDGLEFLKHVRAEYGPARPIIVLCTTEAGIDRVVEALAIGAQEYVMKPFDAGILQDKFVQAGLLADIA